MILPALKERTACFSSFFRLYASGRRFFLSETLYSRVAVFFFSLRSSVNRYSSLHPTSDAWVEFKVFRVILFLQREPPQCPPRPASYTPSSNNEPAPYSNSAAVALNNLDTLRSYGSAGDELENFPPDYLRNLNRTTPVPPPSLTLANPVGGNATGSDTDSLHKPSWQEQMQLASFITDTTKIKNGE